MIDLKNSTAILFAWAVLAAGAVAQEQEANADAPLDQRDATAPLTLTPVDEAAALQDVPPAEIVTEAETAVTPVAAENATEDGAGEGVDDAPALEVNPDDMADMLNSRQQLQQTFTLKRTVNGEVVETDRRTVVYTDDVPLRESEATLSTKEQLMAAFDGEFLTRVEAFEEAKLDFTIADVDSDEAMTADEFATLVDSWRKNNTRQAAAPNEEIKRQRQYEAFLEEISPDAAGMQNEAYAREKFAFMAGAATTITRKDYIREYLLDFDSMDVDKDTILKDEELMRFRALNRGETIE